MQINLINKNNLLINTLGILSLGSMHTLYAQDSDKPNIVVIYADDLGYGDVGCYGATSLQTSNIDRLAAQGLRFTNAYCTSATCTPSRYSLLTGEYAWRRKDTRVAQGDAALIIEPGRTTLPSVMQDAGYATAAVGKWHLGLGSQGGPDWNGEIKPGPAEVGFDYSFIIPATGDRVPCVYVENRKVVNLDPQDPVRVSYQEPILVEPTGRDHPELLKMHPSHGHDMTIVNGISRIGYMSGGRSAWWTDENMADKITGKAVQFIKDHKDSPFFLYFATHDIHVPRVPHPRFAGKSGMGPRGDVILEFDWSVGKLVKTIDSLGLSQKTIIIVTSDNGPVVDDGYRDDAVEKLGTHKPAGILRGGKYSAFEGGTRVPFIVCWDQVIKPGTSDALVSQIDFLASFAALVGQALANDAGPDSHDQLNTLLGRSSGGRKWLVEQAFNKLSVRKGNWKYIEPEPGEKVYINTNIESGNDPLPQLYDLLHDPGELVNIALDRPDIVEELSNLLKTIRENENTKSILP
jgi:arylsulfatase A-like enzyme